MSENVVWTALLLMMIVWNTDCFVLCVKIYTLKFNAAAGALSILDEPSRKPFLNFYMGIY